MIFTNMECDAGVVMILDIQKRGGSPCDLLPAINLQAAGCLGTILSAGLRYAYAYLALEVFYGVTPTFSDTCFVFNINFF